MKMKRGGEGEGVVATRGRIRRRRSITSINKRRRRRTAILANDGMYNLFM